MNQVYRVYPKNTKAIVVIHLAFALILPLIFASADLHAQGIIELGDLPSNFYSGSSPWAINNDGVIVGGASVADIYGEDTVFTFHAVKWQNGQISSIYSSGAYGDVNVASDVNSLGNAAGTIEHSGYPLLSAARWQGGSVETLPVIPDYAWSNGYGINDSGWVVGYDYYIDTVVSHTWGQKAFLWKGSTVTILPDLNANGWSYAKKINNNGIIVGYSTLYGGSPYCWNGCAWFNGKIYTLPPAAGYYQSFAFDINDSNTIVGISDPGYDTYEGVVTTWKVTIINGTDLQISAPVAAPLDYRFNVSYEFPGRQVAINNLNVVVGTGVDTLSDSTVLFVYKDGVFGNLGDLVTVPQIGSSSFTNKYGPDINDSGQIVGIAKFGDPPNYHGFLLTAKYLSINMPAENGLMVAGETNLISWMHLGVKTINIYYQIGESPVQYLIAENYPADANYFVWDVPDTLLSTKVKIRIEDVNSSTYTESKTFRIKGYVLTRLNDNGDYDRFDPTRDGWQMVNDSTEMWPFSWYLHFDYRYGSDPNTHVTYPGTHEYPFFRTGIKTFVDWPLFTETFGVSQCYIPDNDGNLQYRKAATVFWDWYRGTGFFGSCFGFAQSSLLAFDRKATLLSFFGLPDFGNLYDVPVSDSNRKVINRLYERQLADDEDAYNAAAASRTAVDVLEDLKAMMLSNTDDHRSVSLFTHHGSIGGHTMLPYRVIKAPDWPSGYRIYVYDSNNPGDTSIFIFIDTLTNGWYFTDLNWAENTPGTLRLDQPASHYLEPGHIFGPSKAKPALAARTDNGSGYIKMLFSDAQYANINFVAPTGIGGNLIYEAQTGISTSGMLSLFWPIIPATGGPHRPFGFCAPRPEGYRYTAALSQLADSNVSISFRTDSLIWNYSRQHADLHSSDQWDVINYKDSLKEKELVVNYGSEGNRIVDIAAILPGDSYERALDVMSLTIAPGNGFQTSYLQDGDFTITNNGSGSTYCNLRLRQISTAGISRFTYDSLYLEGETRYIIHQPNWDNLGSVPLKILIDHWQEFYGYGTIDDSIILNDQPTDVNESGDPVVPITFALSQNYPNPFNPVTTIDYSVASRSPVRIEIFNILGQSVRILLDDTKMAGSYQITWDGTDQSGAPVSTGIYLYRIQAGDFAQTKKMLLLR